MTRLLFVFSSLALTTAEVGLVCSLAAPRVATGVDVMAPYWAYQLQVGMRLEELRTYSGVTYRNVKILAMTTVQMQFSHSRGTQIELMTNIIDPNQYLGPVKVVPGQGGNTGNGAGNNNGYGAAPLVGKNGPLAREMPLGVRVSSGVEKLTANEQGQLIRWVESDGRRDPGGTGLEKLTRAEQRELIEWVSKWLGGQRGQQGAMGTGSQSSGSGGGDVFDPGHAPKGTIWSSISGFTGFQPGKTFRMMDGHSWQQEDDLALDVPLRQPTTVIFYPVDGAWYMHVRGVAKPVRVQKVH